MSVNYHELTMNEPRDSPARRKQFLVICVFGVGVLLNTVINSGGFHSVVFEEGVVPSGRFIHKMHTMDVAAAMSKIRCALDDAAADIDAEQADTYFNLYVDEPSRLPSGQTRFLSGGLGDDVVSKLSALQTGEDVERRVSEHCDDREYEVAKIPKGVRAVVVQFPFTNGFVSALIQTHKIIPAMSKYARDRGIENPVTFSTCSPTQRMCTHYAPLEKVNDFFFGRQNTAEYVKFLEDEAAANRGKAAVNYAKVWKGIKKLSPL